MWSRPWMRSPSPQPGSVDMPDITGSDMIDRDRDRITLQGLRVHGTHGVFDREKRDGQPFVVDLVVWLDLSPAAASDDLTQTLDYGELAQRVATIVSEETYDLIETLAERIATETLRDARLYAVEVTVHKPHAPIPLSFTDVAVTVRRHR